MNCDQKNKNSRVLYLNFPSLHHDAITVNQVLLMNLLKIPEGDIKITLVFRNCCL